MTHSGQSASRFAVLHNAVSAPDDVVRLAHRLEGLMRRRSFISLVSGTAAILLLSVWDMACSFVFGAPSPVCLAGRAGARPDHPILAHGRASFAVLHNDPEDVVG